MSPRGNERYELKVVLATMEFTPKPMPTKKIG